MARQAPPGLTPEQVVNWLGALFLLLQDEDPYPEDILVEIQEAGCALCEWFDIDLPDSLFGMGEDPRADQAGGLPHGST